MIQECDQSHKFVDNFYLHNFTIHFVIPKVLYAINEWQHSGEMFHGSLDFIITSGKILWFCFWQQHKTTFCIYILAIKMAFIKLVMKTLVVYRKFTKTVKVFSCVTFVVYGMLRVGCLNLWAKCCESGHKKIISHT